MKERPILFNGAMVRAILAGTKTQTRRIADKMVRHPDLGNLYKPGALVLEKEPQHVIERACPYGQPSDRLWVRETWNTFDGWDGFFYAADDHSYGIGESDDPDHVPEHAIRWRPSIHMPRAASRITLEITSVRLERLQEITEVDAVAEGCTATMDETDLRLSYAARYAFNLLWNRINGPDSWQSNPWVWVVEFKRVEQQR